MRTSRRKVVRSAVVAGCVGLLAGTFGVLNADAAQLTYSSVAPLVGVQATASGHGYWQVASDGGVFAFGDASFYGSMGGKPLNKPVVGITATPTGHGYWEVASDGGVFAFGDASFYGSMGGKPLNGEMVAMASTASGHGYWMAASDGGVFAFGDASFYGSMGGKSLNNPVSGITPAPNGTGYLLTASDGGVFAFGSAAFYGSMAGKRLAGAVSSISRTPDGTGYWLSAVDGGLFAFGTAGYYGNAHYAVPTPPATSIGQGAANLALGWRGFDYHGVNDDKWHASYSPQYWCSDFATYVWQHAGRAVPTYPAVTSFWKWAQQSGRATTDLSRPQVGDAIFYGSSHVAIIVAVNANGTIVTADGDTGGKHGTEATFASTSHVLLHGPFDPRTGQGPIGTITGFATIA
jgi:hypothetical protein